ncbi:cation-transporting P-type ATPase [Aureimonas fodinaquatilis]|uniref:Cation-transporting P-type ATPase n=1 Tax=Aureimonas fodinaquatilis TaxID=2565783 RepID=A0A5B0DZI0_9HYPH|nr:cation-transporting P-type ATPase [Aureimonas fodinaquatilis]KAA0970619.1 cation-transporting P-type ATPase [Aureimonas fodinaquatilis]
MLDSAPELLQLPNAHCLDSEQVLLELGSSATGLSPEEAETRLQTFGPNSLPERKPVSPIVRFLAQFNNVLIYFLLSAAIAAFILGHVIDASVIVAVVLINAIIGFLQEGKAEQALNALRDMIAPHANVLRGGVRQSLDVDRLVPGDVVLLEAGDKVPADMRVFSAHSCVVDESILTGESVPAAKGVLPVGEAAALGDRGSMLYSGTIVATGQARGVVVATGTTTEIGKISALMGGVQSLTTPLLQQINRFGELFTYFALGLSVLLFAFATLVRGYSPVDALMVVVALAVGVVPEGLPAVITITLAIGVQRMAQRHAIVRRLPAVETLGATSVICSDKTGTLTRNEMTARRFVTHQTHAQVAGVGYKPEGRIGDGLTVSGQTPASDEDLLFYNAALCNDADLKALDDNWHVLGDPMEGALVALAMKAGLDVEAVRQNWLRVDAIPFDAEHRYMATLHTTPDDGQWIFVKGAPERVLAMCENASADEWEGRIAQAAAQGERVLGFAARRAGAGASLDMQTVQHELQFLGIVGFIDPPREEAIAAIADCRTAGIAVKMITGDHRDTALAIARQLNLSDNPQAMTGAELDKVPDAMLPDVARNIAVFARTNPEHKLRIVRALQSRGDVVAMTGDGVNDAPSLKQANVGVAMGRKGTEAAKEAAEMVLGDDNFASIVAAVREGRTVYDNIRKVIAWTLPTNGGEAIAVVVALLLGLALPMTPAQILWINMVLTVTLGLVLAFEPPEPNVMTRPPRPANAPLLSRFLLWRVVFVSLLFTLGVFFIYYWAMWRGLGQDVARTMVVNTLVVMEIFYLFNVRYLHAPSISWRGIVGTPILLVALAAVTLAQIAFTYLPIMHTLFASQPVPLADGLVIIAIGVALLLILEVEKTLLGAGRLATE